MNLDLYNKVRKVPPEAIKPINAGRLKGMSDINPMWRIKVLTEHFGICGIGWKYSIEKQWLETGSDGCVKAFCNVNLYIRDSKEWSEAIPGTGGADFIAKESRGLYTSDECYKMALTDALSVCMKALGIGADIYFAKDRSKYTSTPEISDIEGNIKPEVKELIALASKKGFGLSSIKKKVLQDFKKTELNKLTVRELKMLTDGFNGLPDK